MTTILWRPEVNALTKPQSYRPRHIPRAVSDNDKIAALMEQKNPLYNESLAKGFLLDLAEVIRDEFLNGNQVTLENLFTGHISFTGRMDHPDDPLPPLEESLQVRFYPSRRLTEAVRQGARTERLPISKKLPLISQAFDTLLRLNDVLNPQGVLQLAGDDLFFDQEAEAGECVLEGTRTGRAVQSRLVSVSNSAVQLMPDIPSQTSPWNNEYKISVSTRYSERGTLRTGTYGRMLRTPLTVTDLGHPNHETGILTGKEDSPHVSIIGGAAAANAMLRIQVILDPRADSLLFSLLDMKEGGSAGPEMTVSANGAVTLQGFSGSAVSSLNIRVNSYAALKDMIRSNYGGLLVDVLVVQ